MTRSTVVCSAIALFFTLFAALVSLIFSFQNEHKVLFILDFVVLALLKWYRSSMFIFFHVFGGIRFKSFLRRSKSEKKKCFRPVIVLLTCLLQIFALTCMTSTARFTSIFSKKKYKKIVTNLVYMIQKRIMLRFGQKKLVIVCFFFLLIFRNSL